MTPSARESRVEPLPGPSRVHLLGGGLTGAESTSNFGTDIDLGQGWADLREGDDAAGEGDLGRSRLADKYSAPIK